MSEADIINLTQEGIRLALVIAAPALGIALLVGLVIAFVQALTQVQEMTLTFVPKIIAILLTAMFSLHFMYMRLADFATELFVWVARPVGV